MNILLRNRKLAYAGIRYASTVTKGKADEPWFLSRVAMVKTGLSLSNGALICR